MERRRDLLAIALVLGFTVSFALTNTTARLAFIGGSDPLTVANARFTFTTLALVVILWATGARFSLPRRDAYVAIALGVVTAVYSFAILSAIEKLGVSLAVLIFFLFPLFTSLIVAVMGWEKLTNTTMVAAVIAFAGLALTLGVDSENLAVNGIIYGLIGAFGLAVVSAVSSRVIRSGDSRPVTLYIVTTAAIVFIALSLFRGDFQLPQTSEGWVGYVGTSVFYAIGIIIYFATIAFIGPAKTALFSYVEPLFT
ncbi:MAG: DMT family transporter, partial [Alphaproteobacteria bacterium]